MVPDQSLLIVKLGGSAVTNKHIPYYARPEVIRNIGEDVKKLLQEHKIIIVHGGGSYGHFTVKRYGLWKKNGQLHKMGISRVRHSMGTLTNIISSILIDYGVPVMPIYTSSIAIRDGNILKIYLKSIKLALENDLVPMLSGDVILWRERGCLVISGDRIVRTLSKILLPRMVIFGVDVDGLLDPISGEIIRSITTREISKLVERFVEPDVYDVTGGIVYKLKEIEKISSMGIEVRVGNITIKRGLFNIVTGKGNFTVIKSSL